MPTVWIPHSPVSPLLDVGVKAPASALLPIQIQLIHQIVQALANKFADMSISFFQSVLKANDVTFLKNLYTRRPYRFSFSKPLKFNSNRFSWRIVLLQELRDRPGPNTVLLKKGSASARIKNPLPEELYQFG